MSAEEVVGSEGGGAAASPAAETKAFDPRSIQWLERHENAVVFCTSRVLTCVCVQATDACYACHSCRLELLFCSFCVTFFTSRALVWFLWLSVCVEHSPASSHPADDVLNPDNEETGIYGAADAASYEVRGENYLVDKVKFPSRPVRCCGMRRTVDVLVVGARRDAAEAFRIRRCAPGVSATA